MSEKVVGLRNRTVPEGAAEPEVVEKIEELLAMAKRGEVIAFAMVLVSPNLEIMTSSRNPRGNRHLLVAGTAYLAHDLCEESGK